ncbi:MAG: LysM peptidoglycan-binding domain-containing protein, partial [Anaerolineae bacterium]|nr:LysM peptidoglycan-binding domain-containing protein [Anaerolineae bacterium]
WSMHTTESHRTSGILTRIMHYLTMRFRSRRIIAAIALVFFAVVLSACGNIVMTPEPEADTNQPQDALPTTETIGTRVTATAPLMPPAATPSPTVTPEPVVHIVQSGDTLYSIAFDYGVSPDSLQAANGIDDPQLLQIGQELTIPQEQDEMTSLTGPQLPTPTPAPLEVQGVGFYETPVGSLWCLGEVVNTNEIALTNVQVRVVLFDAVGEAVVETDGFVAVELLAPGERSPFGILFTSPPAEWANSQVSVVRGEGAGELSSLFATITVSETNGQMIDGLFRTTGTIQNTGAALAADRAQVIITTYDEQGLVTGYRQGQVTLEGPLVPGASAPFEMLFTVHGGPPADFRIIALGRPAQ